MTYLDELTRRIQQRVSTLPQGLRAHVYRARDIAIELALKHSVDPQCAALGALAHDVCRAMPSRELISHATRLGLPIGLVERPVPVLLHGPVGAELLRQGDGLSDQSLYQAVYWHTTAHPSLDSLGKVVFLADKLDPLKIKYYPYQPYLQELAFVDLDRAMLEFLSRELISLTSQGQMVHPAMVEARNALLVSSISAKAPVQ
jgi:predicted HD superfamily hydrolase involved in NAD metabolism